MMLNLHLIRPCLLAALTAYLVIAQVTKGHGFESILTLEKDTKTWGNNAYKCCNDSNIPLYLPRGIPNWFENALV